MLAIAVTWSPTQFRSNYYYITRRWRFDSDRSDASVDSAVRADDRGTTRWSGRLHAGLLLSNAEEAIRRLP
jgi:hypothetical protein